MNKIEGAIYQIRDDQLNIKNQQSNINKEQLDIKNELSSAKDELSSVKDDISGINNDLSGIEDEQKNINTELSNIKAEQTNINVELTSVKTEQTNVNTELTNVKTEQTNINNDLLDIKTEQKNIKTEQENIKNEQLETISKLSGKYDNVTVENQGVLNKLTFYADGVEKKSIEVLAYAQPQPGVLTINYESNSTVKETDRVVIPYVFNTPNKGTATLYVSIVVGESTKDLEYSLTRVGAGSINLGTLTKGLNQLSFYVIDAAGQMTDVTNITIVCGALEITSTFDDSLDYNAYSSITIPFNVSALDNSELTLKVDIDGTMYEKQVYNGYNTFTFPNEMKTIGVHHVSMQVVGGNYQSETLEYNIVIADNSHILLSSTADSFTLEEGYIIEVPYRISMIGQSMFNAKYFINEVLYKEASTQLGKNAFQGDYRDFPVGTYTLRVEVSTIDGSVTSTMNLAIKIVPSSFKRITHVTTGLQAYFNMGSKSNADIDKETLYSEVMTDAGKKAKLVLHNYNFSSNGWINGRLVSNGKTWAEIVDYLPLKDNAVDGFTFDILFKSSNAGDNNARVIECTSANSPYEGFFIDSEKAVLTTESNQLKSYYTDREDMRITFVVNRTSTYYEEYILDENGHSVLNPNPTYKPNPMIQTFINGIFTDVAMLSDQGSGATKIYESILNNEKVLINTDKNKELFGNSEIKSIRIYNRPLDHEEVLQNYIADYDDLMDQKTIYDKNYVTVDSDIPTLNFYDTSIGKCDLMTKDTKQWINIVYTSPNKDLFGESFDLMGQTSWQGTSSLAYPTKNYKFKLYDWARDENGEIIEESRNDTDTYKKKKINMYPSDGNGYPENTFCLKADYMDSSHSRNTGTARLVNDLLFDGYNNPAKKLDPTTRDTINGFPCNLYINGRWMGVFNFNHDKSCTKTLGLETIPDTVRWEIKANSDTSAGAFYKTWTNVEECYAAILADFEIVYDEDAFVDKTGEYDVTRYYDELGFAHDGAVVGSYYDYAILSLARFVNFVSEADREDWIANSDKYFNKVQACRYYLNVMTLGMIDNFAKNCIINMYGDDIWWFSFYDMDSSLGLDNTGYNKFESNIEPSQPGVYNCSTSKMWVKLNDWNQDDLFNQFKAIREGKYTYENICNYLIEKQINVIPQLLYNKDMYAKYISQGRQYLHMLHGNNKDHLKRWLYNRFLYIDSLFLQHNSPYTKQSITIRSCKPTNAIPKYDAQGNIISQYTARFEIQTYSPQYVTVCWRKNTFETKRVDFGETVVFENDMVNSQDNELIVYCATNLKHLGDCSNLNPTSVDIGNANRLIEFVVEDSDKLVKADISKNTFLRRVSFKNCYVMGTASGGSNVIDVSSCTNLREIDIRGTKITSLLTNSNGSNLEKILYPSTIQTVVIANQVNLEVLGLPIDRDVATNLASVQIINCHNIKTLMYPYDEDNPSLDFSRSMKHVQNLTLDNSLDLTHFGFKGFSNLRNITIKNMLELESLGFDDMLGYDEAGIIEKVTLTNIPKIKTLTLKCTSQYYAIRFAPNAVLDLSGLTSLEAIESNYSIGGLDKIILPLQLKRLVFDNTFGDGKNDIKRIYSAASLDEREFDNLECIDLKDMVLTHINMDAFKNITVGKNFNIIPTNMNPNFNIYRDNVIYPYLDLEGSIDLTQYTESMDYMFKGLDMTKFQVIVSGNKQQKTLTGLFQDAKIESKDDVNRILNCYPLADIWNALFKNADISFDTDDIPIPDKRISTAEMYRGTNITKDIDIPNTMINVQNMFRDCKQLKTYVNNWDKEDYYDPEMITSGCYFNSGGDLELVPPEWGGYGFYPEVTSEIIVTIPYENYELVLCSKYTTLSIGVVNWGDGNITFLAEDNYRHIYKLPGRYTIKGHFTFGPGTRSYESGMYFSPDESLRTVLTMVNYLAQDTTDLCQAFKYCRQLKSVNIPKLKVTSLQEAFNGCTSLSELNYPGTSFNDLTAIHSAFSGCQLLESIDLSNMNTKNVKDMHNMFYNCASLKQADVSGFVTDQVENMADMFRMCSSLEVLDLSNFVTDKVTNMSRMFDSCNSLIQLDISSFVTDKVTNMVGMFARCGLYELDLSHFNTESVENMTEMFLAMPNLTKVDLSSFNTSKVTSMAEMFYRCVSLTELDLTNFDVSNVTDMMYMFTNCGALKTLILGEFNASKVLDFKYFFSGCSELTELDLSNFTIKDAVNIESMFINCSGLTSLSMPKFDTSNVITFRDIFSGCRSARYIDVSSFNTSAAEDLGGMFNYCPALETVDVNHFDTRKVIRIDNFFKYCRKLKTIDLSNWETPLLENMEAMFFECYELEDVKMTKFISDNLTNARELFNYDQQLKTIDFGQMTFSLVDSMENMFNGCYSLETLDLSNFNTFSATSMKNMFGGCYGLTNLILGDKFTTKYVKDFSGMFSNNGLLTGMDFSKWDFSSAEDLSNMFEGCSFDVDLSNKNMTNVLTTHRMFRDYNGTSINMENCDISNSIDNSDFIYNVPNLISLIPPLNIKTSMTVVANNLPVEAYVAVINNLVSNTKPQTLVVGPNNIDRIPESSISIAISKNWSIS